MKIPEYTAADIPVLQKKYTITQWAVIVCLIGMVVIFTANNILYPWGSITVWCIQCVPLLAFLPAIFKHRYRAYSWLCFVILPYFMNTVVHAMASNARILSFVLLLFIVVLFICAMMASRYRQHSVLAVKQNPTATPSV